MLFGLLGIYKSNGTRAPPMPLRPPWCLKNPLTRPYFLGGIVPIVPSTSYDFERQSPHNLPFETSCIETRFLHEETFAFLRQWTTTIPLEILLKHSMKERTEIDVPHISWQFPMTSKYLLGRCLNPQIYPEKAFRGSKHLLTYLEDFECRNSTFWFPDHFPPRKCMANSKQLLTTLAKTDSSPLKRSLKSRGWKMTCPFRIAYFRELYVFSFR